MPSTPRLYAGSSPDNSSNARNGNGIGISASSSIISKDHLLLTRSGPPLLGKEPSPFDGSGMRFETTIGGDTYSESKIRAIREANMQVPSTSQLPVEPRNGVKEETLEEEKKLKRAIQSLFSPCFKTSRTRAWQKSRKIDESEWMLSREELDEQLRPEEEGLVPLNAIAGRMVLYGWQLFANQVEINASLSPLKRRKRIYDDAHEARKQLIKLLVLVQWSKVAPELQTARSLIAFINDHFVQTDAAVNALSETRSILTSARLRKYDLVTAIEALGTGGPQWIPPILKDVVQAQRPYTDLETINLIDELEEAIRLRLACEEILPMPMASYTISDGRARFRVPGLFEVDLTLSGSSKEDRWWLLRVKFDFTVTGDGAERFPRQPKKQQRIHLLALADTELAPRSVAALVEPSAGQGENEREAVIQEREAETGGDVEMGDSLTLGGQAAERRDAPLVRLYNLIQSQALQYWLDILHFQASQQSKLGWSRHLSVRMETLQRSRALHLTYWLRDDAEADKDKDSWRPTASGKLTISVQDRPRENGSEKVLKQLSATAQEEKSEHSRGQMVDRLEMHVDWETQGPAAEFVVNRRIIIDSQDLDTRKLLLEVTRRHAEASMKAIKARIAASSLAKIAAMHDSRRSTEKRQNECLLRLTLGERLTVVLQIDQISGQIRLEQTDEDHGLSTTSASHEWLSHLRDISSKINEKPDQIVPILQALRSKAILEDLQEKSLLLGISVTSRLPLRPVDYAQLRARPGSLMYIALKQCPGYYLVIHIGEETLRVALLCTGTFFEDLITSVRIVSLEWLDWKRVISSSAGRKSQLGRRKREATQPARTFTQDELSTLYSYSVALICYHKVEQQLRARNVSFIYVGGWTNARGPPSSVDPSTSQQDAVDEILPSICLNASNLLGTSTMETANRNASIRLYEWWDPGKASVAVSVKLKLTPELGARESILETDREKIRYKQSANVISFSYRDIDNCLFLFSNNWRHIDRILDLNKVLTLDTQKDFFSVTDFDLIRVRFTYAIDYLAEVRWVQNISLQKGGYYALAFESIDDSQGSRKNPHRVLEPTLAQWLNGRNDASTSFWSKFLQILRQMLPLLKHVCHYPEQCLESIDCPELLMESVYQFRLKFLDRFELDVRLLTTSNQVLFSDAASVKTKSNASRQIIEDEFSFISETDKSKCTNISNTSDAIPSLHSILIDLYSQYQQQESAQESNNTQRIDQKDQKEHIQRQAQHTTSSSSPVLVFENGILCPNQPIIIDWFLPRLIKRIQEAIV